MKGTTSRTLPASFDYHLKRLSTVISSDPAGQAHYNEMLSSPPSNVDCKGNGHGTLVIQKPPPKK